MSEGESSTSLRRTLTLPWLVFYGVGVTVGAGIFALVGEILGLAGDQAPLAFLVAGLIAGITGVAYMLLVQFFPRAGGEAVFVNQGLGSIAGRMAGFGVVVTGIVSSAVIAIAFAGYVHTLVEIPEKLTMVVVVAALALVARQGVRESVMFAAAITVLEVGTLIVVIAWGVPLLGDTEAVANAFTPSFDGVGVAPILSASVVAFFAFIGFEDIENMAEETIEPRRTTPRAIFLTLAITMVLYVLLATIAALVPDREAVTESSAPLAAMFEELSGVNPKPIAAIAAIAMINGILVQIVMASRVLYGMAGEGLIPAGLGDVDSEHQTPVRATALVAAVIIVLAMIFPLVRLAQLTSLVTLAVFALVNLALFTPWPGSTRDRARTMAIPRLVGCVPRGGSWWLAGHTRPVLVRRMGSFPTDWLLNFRP
jgi:APA family basic amino acid/polyamine antiporter